MSHRAKLVGWPEQRRRVPPRRPGTRVASLENTPPRGKEESMPQAGTIDYAVGEGWEQLHKGYTHRDVAGVAVDGEDRVYLICRGDHPVMVYDQKGNFLRSWGEGGFTYRTHGISVGPNGTIFCTDDGNHTVRQFTPEGKLLMTLGVMNTRSDTG